ncbi:MAG: ATP-dependent Clp protease adaptor ClpS [Deltaproteobacteria bacterium]|nr:ATP-dependent Clp protease adaptor ClpS [Deltaproteobacteria bacterium]MBW2393546.1 ATP-dependent Clp protease adaptor ClpS [Deltaproteobacteria bacterium]
MSNDPGGPPGGGTWRDREGGVAEKTRKKEARPPRFKVVLYNDDYTPMAFVVELLESVFRKSPVESNALMLRIHRAGSGIAGVYTLEVAETKVATVHRQAEERGFPLRSGVEEE